MAVIILSQAVTDKGFGQLPSIGLIDTLPANTSATVVGYGAVGTSKGKPPRAFQYDDLRHYAVSYVTQNNGVLSEEFVQLTGNPGNGKGGTCVGDSGGPALLGSSNTVLATTSLGTGRNCIGIQYSYRLDAQSAQDFIESVL